MEESKAFLAYKYGVCSTIHLLVHDCRNSAGDYPGIPCAMVHSSWFPYQKAHISLEDAKTGKGEGVREGVQSLWGKLVLEVV